MPEYLSPGVFIEEVPSGLKAIEGVSTSTAAFVGPAGRGPVPGYAPPFTPSNGFLLTPDPATVLVTSFAEFQRTYGAPLPLPLPGQPDFGYLGYAVRAFFDNGGKRAYITRIVDAAATRGTLRIGQGVAYRLLRSASAGDDTVYLTSTRGLAVGNQIAFINHADGSNPLSTSGPARLAGTLAEPFALQDGDHVTITPSLGAVVDLIVVAKPMVATSVVGTFDLSAIVGGLTLDIRVGPASEPVQTLVFQAGDFAALNAATAAEVAAVLARDAIGVGCAVVGGAVVLHTDVAGTAAGLAIAGGSLAPVLNFAVTQGAGSNVPDARHVHIADLQAIPAVAGSPDILLADDGTHHLRIATRATGAISLTLSQPAGSTALARLGFTGALTASGAGAALSIMAYDMQSNSITLSSALSNDLAAGEVYAVAPAGGQPPVAGAGPLFFARAPGAWSGDLSVTVALADRAPVKIGAVNVAQGKLKVLSVASFYVGAVVEVDHNGQSRTLHQVAAVNAPLGELTLSPAAPLGAPAIASGWVRTLEIDITLADESGVMPTETYKNLSWNQDPVFADLRRHYAWQINANSRLAWVQPPGTGTPLLAGTEDFHLNHQPLTADGFPLKLGLAGTPGNDGPAPGDAAYVGVDNGPGLRSGIESFKDFSDIRIVAAPGQTSQTVQLALIAQCELLRYRFAILDGELEPQAGSLTSILKHRNLYDTSFAAYYAPWITVSLDGQSRYLPPSGFLAGLCARVDNARGVWKAPANEPVLNALALKTNFTTGEQDVLNPRGVNLIRRFDIGGIRVWGARTLSSDPDVKYINVRRTLIFLEASIDQGTPWVVFEPNTPETWTRLGDSVSAFLTTQWRSGALFGRKPEEAFFVRCDETTMTSDDILNGRLVCHIGVAIVRPAEFVIFRIEQITKFGSAG